MDNKNDLPPHGPYLEILTYGAGGMDPVELAAWTLVGNVMLNLDEVFAKR